MKMHFLTSFKKSNYSKIAPTITNDMTTSEFTSEVLGQTFVNVYGEQGKDYSQWFDEVDRIMKLGKYAE